MTTENVKSSRKIRIGRVVSNKMDKTIIVMVERLKKHALYGKTIKQRRKFVAHDEQNQCQIGDTVKIMESRPLSKLKRWNLLEVIEKAGLS